jgi:hypothetical protein
MPSKALETFLEPVLVDAREIIAGHSKLSTGLRGRQWGLGGLNRSVVVMCAAAWESYVEEVVREAADALRPVSPPIGTWPALAASIRGNARRLNTPNSQNVRRLIAESFGLSDVTTAWSWRNCPPGSAAKYLDAFLNIRHQVAHGANPRPTVHNKYASWLPGFVERLASRTDRALVEFFAAALGTSLRW